jgi:bifunctional non-homologous end joining protein LigD
MVGDLSKIPGARKSAMPKRLAPILATLAEGPFTDPAWYFEPKLDGYRILAFVRDGQAKLQSRHFQDYTDHFPAVTAEIGAQPVGEAVFDGELVALDKRNRPCFQCLQQHVKQRSEAGEKYTLHYYVFDLLHLDGYDLTGAPQSARVELLDKVLKPGKAVKAVPRLEGDGAEIFTAALDAGMEGVIAKRRDAIYQPGKRSKDWLKIKGTLSDEFIIAGYTAGQGARAGAFGSLVLGQYDDMGRFSYSGNAGTGFDERLLDELKARMDKLVTGKSPFTEKIPFEATTTWLKPKLVAEVKFAERTREGSLRAPVFLRLREDKPVKEVRPQKVEGSR